MTTNNPDPRDSHNPTRSDRTAAAPPSQAYSLEGLRIDQSLKQQRGRRSRWPYWLMGLLIAGLASGYMFRRPAAAEVEVYRVPKPLEASEDGKIVLNATGYVVASHSIALAPKVGGRVSWIGVEMGDKVEQGQQLVKLEDEDFQARLVQSQGNLLAAQAKLAEYEAGSRQEEITRADAEMAVAMVDLENARSTVQRNRELAGTNAISEQQLDDSEARFRSQEARVNAIRAALDLVKAGPRSEQIDAQRAIVKQAEAGVMLAENELKNTTITAPLAGTILERNVEVGEFVSTGYVSEGGAKGYVVSLADLSNLRVELDISQSDFKRVAMAQKAVVTTDAYPDRKYDGMVELISPGANRQKATILVKVKINNPDEYLKPDMNANVAFERIGVEEGGKPILPGFSLPASAVRDGKVFLFEGDKAVARPVEAGASADDKVRVTSGLEGGETVIVNIPANLIDGSAVKLKEPS